MRAFILVSALLATSAWADEALWARLKSEPNMVVLMRHTAVSPGNGAHWDESGNCAGEMMLSQKGREQAKRIGGHFAARGIKPAVITSPMCRCRETARLAFGGNYPSDPDLREIATGGAERTEAFLKKALALIGARRGKAPLVFVNHMPNIAQLTLEEIATGEAVVARAGDNGELEVLGRMELTTYK